MNLTAADIAYVRAGFDSLDEICRRRGEDPAAVRSLPYPLPPARMVRAARERFADVWATAPL
jgi:hypothetical protein